MLLNVRQSQNLEEDFAFPWKATVLSLSLKRATINLQHMIFSTFVAAFLSC